MPDFLDAKPGIQQSLFDADGINTKVQETKALEFLAIFRHGKDRGGSLADMGKEQIWRFTNKLENLEVPFKNAHLLHSDVTRCIEGAEMLSQEFKFLKIIENPQLFYFNWEEIQPDLEKYRQQYQTVVIATHLDGLRFGITDVGEWLGFVIEGWECGNGAGIIINITNKQLIKIWHEGNDPIDT